MTLTETLVKKELEQQSGKIWERKVLNENGKDVIVFVAKEDDISPCFCMNKLEDALRSDKDITIVQYIKDFLKSVNTKQSTVKTKMMPIKISVWEKIKYNIEELLLDNSWIISIIIAILFTIIGCVMISIPFKMHENLHNEIEEILNEAEEGE